MSVQKDQSSLDSKVTKGPTNISRIYKDSFMPCDSN